MNAIDFTAKVLGLAVERAAKTPFEVFEKNLETRESVVETITERVNSGDIENSASYDLYSVSRCKDKFGEYIEIDVMATNGCVELNALYKARKNPNIADLRWPSIPHRNPDDDDISES